MQPAAANKPDIIRYTTRYDQPRSPQVFSIVSLASSQLPFPTPMLTRYLKTHVSPSITCHLHMATPAFPNVLAHPGANLASPGEVLRGTLITRQLGVQHVGTHVAECMQKGGLEGCRRVVLCVGSREEE